MEDRYRVPLWLRISRRFMRVFFRTLFRLLGKVEINGFENIPDHNRYVIIFNHVSLVEIPFIAAYWPTIVEIIGAVVVWTRGYQGWVARMWGGIQVNRTAFDREVFKKVQMVFDADRPLMISPEGTRSHTPGLQRGKPGVAYIVDQADAEILPVAVVGNTLDFLTKGLKGDRQKLQMFVGKPFKVPPLEGRGEAKRQQRQQNTDIMMAKLAALLPEDYRGVYREYKKILAGEFVDLPDPEPSELP